MSRGSANRRLPVNKLHVIYTFSVCLAVCAICLLPIIVDKAAIEKNIRFNVFDLFYYEVTILVIFFLSYDLP